MTVREAKPHDLGRILELWRNFMREEMNVAEPNPKAEKSWFARLESQIAEEKAIVVEMEGSIQGFMAHIDAKDRAWIPEGVAYIVDIYVSPEARVSSAARELFLAAGKLFVGRYGEIWTNTRMDNERMKILLKRGGFISLEGFKIEGLEGHLYFRKILKSAVCESADLLIGKSAGALRRQGHRRDE